MLTFEHPGALIPKAHVAVVGKVTIAYALEGTPGGMTIHEQNIAAVGPVALHVAGFG